ncbi:MAG: hypothetical protein RLZ33_1523 [Bacteroidota bacterium]|jgi:hypothetical protein
MRKSSIKKTVLFLCACFIGLQLNAQNLEFTLNKGLTVGCYNANPLTDVSKKINLTQKDQLGTLTLVGMNCSRETIYTNMGALETNPQAILFFNEKEKKGFIVEKNEKLIVFEKKTNYEIVAVGHIDKKQAKLITLESENPVFSGVLSTMDNVLSKSIERKKAEEMVKKTAKVPTTEYTDEYGISGIYYLSKPLYDEKNDKYVYEVNFQFEVEKGNLKIHYHEGLFDEAFIEQVYLKPLKEKRLSYIYFKANNMTNIDFIEDRVIQPLEKDIYFVSTGNYNSDTRLDCSSVKIIDEKDANGKPIRDYLIIGKDKKRVEELMADHALVEKLYIASNLEECESYNVIRAGRNPMPAQGLVDPKLSAEGFGFMKQEAASHNWPQKLEYAYIKSKDWVITRHKTTGVPLYRSLVIVTVMTSNGKCQWEESFIKQDYNGSTYGKSYFGGNSGNIVPAECSDALKYK